MAVIHLLGAYSTFQDDENPIELQKLNLKWEKGDEVFLPEDISLRLNEHWVTNQIGIVTWKNIYKRSFLNKYDIRFPSWLIEDMPVGFKALCFAKKYLILRDAFYIWRDHPDSLSHLNDLHKLKIYVKSAIEISRTIKEVMEKFPVLKENRNLVEQSALKITNYILPCHTGPFYNGADIPIELDNTVYEALFPTFGENTMLVKYLFHGYNNMWRQAQVFAAQRNYLARQNHLLQQKLDELTAKQEDLNIQLQELLEELFGKKTTT